MAVVLSKSFSNCFDQVQKACTAIERGKLKKAGNILYSLRKDAKVLHRECEKYQSSLRRFEEQKQRDIEEMSSRINDLYNQERDLEREKSELCVQRTALKDRKQIEHRSLQDAQQSYHQAETNRQNEQEEVDHLNRWWWVPIYGQILAVRELIEDHSGNARKAAADMALYQQRIDDAQRQINTVGNKIDQVEKTIQLKGDCIKILKRQRDDLHENLGTAKKVSRLFLEASTFWETIAKLSDNASTKTGRLQKIYNFVAKIKLRSKIIKILNSDGTRTLMGSFKECWMEIENMVQNNNFVIVEESIHLGPNPTLELLSDKEEISTKNSKQKKYLGFFKRLHPFGKS